MGALVVWGFKMACMWSIWYFSTLAWKAVLLHDTAKVIYWIGLMIVAAIFVTMEFPTLVRT